MSDKPVSDQNKIITPDEARANPSDKVITPDDTQTAGEVITPEEAKRQTSGEVVTPSQAREYRSSEVITPGAQPSAKRYVVDRQGQRLNAERGVSTEDLLKGALAGLVGGLVGTAVKSVAEEFFPPRAPSTESPPVVLAEKVAGAETVEGHEDAVEQGIHWTFGVTTGMTYGALVEASPRLSTGYGIPFGAALFAMTHGASVPALGLEDPPTERPLSLQTNEFVTHLFYGVAVDLTRRFVREML